MTNIHKAAREALPHFEEALDSALEQLQEATIKYAGYKQDKITAMEREYQAGRAALATLRAALDEAPGEEREGWRATMARLVAWIDDCGSCLDPDPQPIREARAMLAARPDPEHAAARQRIVGPSLPELVDRLRDAVPEVSGQVAARPSVPQGEPVAWAHADGRVVPASTMEAARRDGGAMMSSLRDYTVPLYARPSAPTVALTQRQVLDEFYVLPPSIDSVTSFEAGVRFAERAHGITEGKEGGA